MQPDEEILKSIREVFAELSSYLRQIAQGMLKANISKYPIFVAMRSEIDLDLGLPVVHKEEMETDWSFNASHLEDFVHKEIIFQDKIAEFIKNYKNPTEYICIFLAEEGFYSFVFLPYNEPTKKWEINKENLN